MNKIYKCTLCNKNKHIDETPYYYVEHDKFLGYKICMCCAIYYSYEGSEYKKIQNYNLKQILLKNTDANYGGIIILMRIGIENKIKQPFYTFQHLKCRLYYLYYL